jgi:hypothetical protein
MMKMQAGTQHKADTFTPPQRMCRMAMFAMAHQQSHHVTCITYTLVLDESFNL